MTDHWWDFSHFQNDCYAIAAKSGFHDNDAIGTPLGKLQLIQRLHLVTCEVAEATEELRDGNDPTLVYHSGGLTRKPEGVPIELADVVIRVFALAEAEGIDMSTAINMKMAYNRTRERMHGKTC